MDTEEAAGARGYMEQRRRKKSRRAGKAKNMGFSWLANTDHPCRFYSLYRFHLSGV